MNGLKKYLVLFFAWLFFLNLAVIPSYAFNLSFKKEKPDIEKDEPMVHTVDEWLERATSVNMDAREQMKDPFLKEDEKIIPPAYKTPSYIEAYNLKAGSKELNLTLLNKNKIIRSPFIASPDFDVAAYTESYLYPQTKQVASAIFLINLDKSLSKKDRLKNTSVFENERYMLVTTALPYFYDGFFSTLTVVDFSSDGKKILIKEKRGSDKNGLYETYVWVYYITREQKQSHPAYIVNYMANNIKPTFDNLNDGSTNGFKASNNEYYPDLNSISRPPSTPLVEDDFLYTRAKKMQNEKSKGTASGNSDNSGNNDIKQAQNSPYEYSAPRLNYKDLAGFLKATWKYEELNSGLNTRWHNAVPDIYRANYDIGEKQKIGFGIRFNLLNDVIKSYWYDKKKLILNSIRWDIKPLGFNKNDSDEFIVDAYTYANDGNKVSLGRWAVNINDGIPRLTDDFEDISIEANAFWLIEKHNK